MKVLFISTFLAAGLIIFGGVGSFANETTGGSANNKGQTEGMNESANEGATGEVTQETTVISGKIADIQGDSIKIKDENGNIQTIKLSGTEELENLRTQDLKAGDRVHAEMKDGKLVSLYKAGSSGNMKQGMKGENMKGNASVRNTKEGTAEGNTAVGSSGTEETSGNTGSMSEKMAGAAEGKQYTVKRGDTLAKIAQKTLGSSAKWREIARLNDINDPNTIRVGQHLTLPRTPRNTTGSEEGSSGTMEEGTKGMKGNTGTEEGTKGNTETAPEQAAPNPEEGNQPLKNQDTDQNQESGQGTTGTSK